MQSIMLLKRKAYAIQIIAILFVLMTSNIINPQHLPDKEKLEEEYRNVLILIGEQNIDKAIIKLKNIIEEAPYFDKAYLKIFETVKLKKDLSSCLQYFQSLVQKNPTNLYGHYGIGLIFKEQKQWQKAIQQFHQSLRYSPEYPKLYKDYIDLMNEANQLEQAFLKINAIIQANPDHATAYFALGYLHQLQRNWEKGIESLDKSIQLNPGLLDAYVTKGVILWYTSRFQEFSQVSQLGLSLAEKENDLEFQCNFSGNIGLAYMYLSNYDESEKYCHQSLTLAIKIGNKTEEVRNHGNLGVIFREKGRYDEALNNFSTAVVKAQEIGDRRREGLFLRNVGSVYSMMGENVTAIKYFQLALPLTIEIGDKNSEALALWSLGNAYTLLGNYYLSIDFLQQALTIATNSADKWGQARYLGTIGLNYWHLGNYSQALENFESGLNLAKEIGDKSEQARQFGNIAIIYHELGDFNNGLEYYQQALKMTREIGDKAEEARHLGNIGVLYHGLHNHEMALRNYQHALKIYREIGDRLNEAVFLGNIGYLFIEAKEYASSENYISQALEITRDIQDKRSEACQYINLGDLFLIQKDYNQALINFKKGLEIGERIKNPKLVIEARFGLGKSYEALNQLKKSLAHYQIIIDEIEKQRSSLPTEKFKIGFLENNLRIYEGIIAILAKLHEQFPSKNYDRQAFYYAERAKARSQIDIVYQGKVFQNLAEIPGAFKLNFLINETQVENKHQKLSYELAKTEQNQDKELIRSLTGELELLQREKTKLVDQLKIMHPEYYQLTNPQILASGGIQRQVLRDNQILIEYFVGEENIFCWILTKQRLKFEILDLNRYQLENKLAHVSPLFRREKETTDLKLDHRWANIQPDLLVELYQSLIPKPAQDMIKQNAEIIIVPDDILFYFPFEILVTEIEKNRIQYLVERFPIAYSASASLLNPELRKTGIARRELLALGNPYLGEEQKKGFLDWVSSVIQYRSIFRDDKFQPLPNAELEVKVIAENFENPEVLVGRQATETHFKESAGQFRFIHIATHHVLNDKFPMYSKILLAPDSDKTDDGYLQTYEVYNLKLNAEMVVLSGCNTGLGKLSRGEGMIGMTRAFMYAGVPSAVVSLWHVDDESTSDLMKSFYRYLNDGFSKTLALQKTKIELIKSRDWKRDPFYWGAFVMVGN